MSSRY
jgi:hypothetical protein